MSVPTDSRCSKYERTTDRIDGIDGQPTLTNAGRLFCEKLADRVLGACARSDSPPACTIWEAAAPAAGLWWSVCSTSRLVGGLPARDRDGTQLIDGPHEYVIKLELGGNTVPIAEYGNRREALVWEQAREREVADLFAPVVSHAIDYRWLVMEEATAIGQDTWGGHGTPPLATYPITDSLSERLEHYEHALTSAGLDFGTSFYGQVGIDRHDRLVALDYEHLRDATARTDPVWAGTYDPSCRSLITVADARVRNTSYRFRVLRWLTDRR